MLVHLRTGVPAGDTGRVALEGIQTLQCETLRGVFTLGDLHLSAGTFLHLHRDGSHHGLTGKLVETALAVIEHIPLTVDLADRAVGVAAHVG